MAIKKMVRNVKVEVMNRMRAAPLSTKDIFSFLGGLPAPPAIPVSLLPANSLLAAAGLPRDDAALSINIC